VKNLFLFVLFLSAVSFAQTDDLDYGVLEFPLVDVPYNTANHGRFPSMKQSLSLTKSLVHGTHIGMQLLIDPENLESPGILARFLMVLVDGFILSTLPGYTAWLHEEWHRAVMGQYGIDSYNGVYDYKGGGVIPVKKVRDEDLVRLKAEHPEDQVRLSSAGMEADIYLFQELNRDDFRYQTLSFNMGTKILNAIGVISYLTTCDGSESDRMTDKSNSEEREDISVRDFTGLDCNAWVYDLFRSQEPYQNRGPHPYGKGLNRYVRYSDLSDGERKFLKRSTHLSWLNLIDPMLYGKMSFGDLVEWNGNFKHYLTSFGNSVDLNMMFSHPHGIIFATYHHYFNVVRNFPGFSLELVDSTMLRWGSFAVDLQFHLWQQPKALYAFEHAGQVGGMTGTTLNYLFGKSQKIYLEGEVKSPGWVAGVVQQGQAANARLGYQWIY